MWRRTGLALAALPLVAACAIASPDPVPAPADLTAAVGPGYARLRWTRTCGNCSRLELQVRTAGTDWVTLSDSLPPQLTAIDIPFTGDLPELFELRFRLRAGRVGDPPPWSPWSNEAVGIVPIFSPNLSYPTTSTWDSAVSWIDVSWALPSKVADAFEFQRSEVGPLGPVQWTAVPMSPGQTSYRDHDVAELKSYAYRARSGTGGVWSEWSGAVEATLPLRQPTETRAVVTPRGVQVTWTNRSAAASGVVVYGSPLGPSPVLPRDATSWVDPAWPPWPTAQYWVEATAPTLPPTPLPTAPGALPVGKLEPFQLSGPAATLDARADGFLFPVTVRDPTGAFYALTTDPAAGGLAVARLAAAGWEMHSLGHAYPAPPGLVLDGAGHPHLAGIESTADGLTTLTRHWHDGTGWLVEDLGTEPIPAAPLQVALDAAGDLQILYAQGMAFELVHGRRVGGQWSWAAVPGLKDDPWFSFAVGPDGTAYVLSRGVLATLPPQGAWSSEQVPSNLQGNVLAASGGDVAIVGVDATSYQNQDLLYVARHGGAWGAEPILQVMPGYRVALGRSPDGARVHVLATRLGADMYPRWLELFERQDGTWTSMQLTPTAPSTGTTSLGYGASGKLWIEVAGSLWEEP
jgi:hypothetical protein